MSGAAANHRRRVALLVVLFLMLLVLMKGAPQILIADNAEVSDYIIVLDGHDQNYYVGLDLLRRGFGSRMFVCLDLPDIAIRGEERMLDMEFIHKTAGELADKIDLCTNESDEDLTVTLKDRISASAARRVLLVTPEPASRGQLISFHRQLPQYYWTVKSVPDASFNTHWWRHRRWTKTFLSSLIDLGYALRVPASSSQSIDRSSR